MPKKTELWYVILDDTSKPREFDNITVIDDFKQYFRTSDSAGHNTNMCGVVRELIKDAKILTFPFFKYEAQDKIIDWIIENQSKIGVVSLSATLSKPSTEKFKRLEAADIPIICGSGNGGKDFDNSTAKLLWTISVGAFDESFNNIPNYSNGGVDIVAFSGIWIYTGTREDGTKRYKWVNGTSCAAPFAGSMLWLYMTRTGIKFNRQQGFDFVRNNTIDILEKGHDNRSGYGLFILPENIEEGSKTMFTDIDDRYEESQEAIKWAVEKGYMKGYAGQREGEFGPTEPVTREQFAIAIKRIVEGGE